MSIGQMSSEDVLLGLMCYNLLEGNDGNVRMIRKVRKRERDMKKHCIVPTIQCEEENVKIWNCFWVGELGLSVFEDGTVNHDDYNIILARNLHF